MAGRHPAVSNNATPESIQLQMAKTRDSISKTLSKLGDSMSTEYDQMRNANHQLKDWRTQVRRHPFASTATALFAGVVVGGALASANRGETEELDVDFTGEPTFRRRHHPRRASEIIHQVRQTEAFEQLQSGLSHVANELIQEFVDLGREVVVPMIIDKVRHSFAAERAPRSRREPSC